MLISKKYKYIIALVVFSVLSGCTATILKKPITKQNKAWKVSVIHGYDNVPYTRGNTIFQPEHGHRLIRITLKIENKTNRAREFKLDQVVLAHKNKATTPSIVDANKGVTFRANRRPKLAPRETITRLLYYVFPNELKPDRVYIKGIGSYKLPDYKKKI